MDTMIVKKEKMKEPKVFSYSDYRQFLKDYYQYKKSTSNAFSIAGFANKAGLTTKNYLKRVMDGERPLNAELIPKFCNGLGLKDKERAFFEALVNFNQAKDQDIKRHYFSILKATSVDEANGAIELMENQFEVFANWYILPIRELVLLKEFQEDPQWIVRIMKSRVSKAEATHALIILKKLGLLVRDDKTGKLKQAESLLRYSKDVINMAVRDYHIQTLENTKQTMNQDDFESWNVRSLNIAVPKSEIKNVQSALNDFISQLNKTMTAKVDAEIKAGGGADAVIQLNAQVMVVTK
jgi:uncharacterized protein (TIGR02147 family)